MSSSTVLERGARVASVLIGTMLFVGFVSVSGARAARGSFVVTCDYSHSLPNDPIVLPGQPGASHLHDFFGNEGTNANSTVQSMRGDETNCRLLSDRAGYWSPAVYEESIRVPFVVRFDRRILDPREDDHLVANIDLAPTFAELGGRDVTDLEGRSLVELMDSSEAPWRTGFLLEHLQRRQDRGVPTYCGVRSRGRVYVRYVTGEEELYDLTGDPLQLVNLVGRDRYEGTLRHLRDRMKHLCRPRPPGYRF